MKLVPSLIKSLMIKMKTATVVFAILRDSKQAHVS